jgi:aminopeptidase C
MQRRQLTVETKDKPHVKMYGMTRHVVDGAYEDRDDIHYLPVDGYDDMSTIEINRKQLGWAVVGYGHLDQLIDKRTGRMKPDVVQFKQELDLLINSPESKYGLEYEAKLRAEIEVKVRAEIEAAAKAQAENAAAKAKPEEVAPPASVAPEETKKKKSDKE